MNKKENHMFDVKYDECGCIKLGAKSLNNCGSALVGEYNRVIWYHQIS